MSEHKDNGIDYVQIVGKNLQKIRKDNDITQLQLGKMIGVDRAIISRMENPTSKTNPGVKDLQRIANALNIDILSFFSLDGQIYEKESIDELINSVKELTAKNSDAIDKLSILGEIKIFFEKNRRMMERLISYFARLS